ncbi:uncharacterized protein DDB_G0287625-like [Athalia rosae]|uniref:uncharacterized protein DDB_G0287625-like n=1 Tax=Athalia rosae TaxID=37344 RepID=UPI002033EBB4|nr:uncharacterized protein DDB_G0287625-like [Athalia rosae]
MNTKNSVLRRDIQSKGIVTLPIKDAKPLRSTSITEYGKHRDSVSNAIHPLVKNGTSMINSYIENNCVRIGKETVETLHEPSTSTSVLGPGEDRKNHRQLHMFSSDTISKDPTKSDPPMNPTSNPINDESFSSKPKRPIQIQLNPNIPRQKDAENPIDDESSSNKPNGPIPFQLNSNIPRQQDDESPNNDENNLKNNVSRLNIEISGEPSNNLNNERIDTGIKKLMRINYLDNTENNIRNIREERYDKMINSLRLEHLNQEEKGSVNELIRKN